MKSKKIHLADYLNTLQAKGRYFFTREEALQILGKSTDAFRFAALRLIKKKRLMRPKQGCYVIVPTEYMGVGVPPVAWFIDSLMKFHQQNYYVGLLSAAALYGAAHQQPQIFQVITNKPLRIIKSAQTQIQFFTKSYIEPYCYQMMKTPTGYMQVSLPEVTAIDLVRYVKAASYLSHIATVLSELVEQFDIERLANLLGIVSLESTDIQRVGYLLELVGTDNKIISLLKQWVKYQNPRFTPLRLDKSYHKQQANIAWHLYINEEVETDI